MTGVTFSSAGAPVTASAGLYPIVPSAALGPGLDNYTSTYVNGVLTGIGIDYSCYETRVKQQPNRKVGLTDQFGGYTATASTIERFCNPTTITTPLPDAPPIEDSWVHMTWYRIKADLRFFKRVKLTIANQLGANQKMTVETTPRFLVVPTQKTVLDGHETGLGDPSDTNHYVCYQVTGSGSGSRSMKDEFGTDSTKLVKPAYLCAPATKVFGGTTTPTDNLNGAHLVCYQAAQNKKSEHTVNVKDQFGAQTLQTRLTGYTCLSSTKTLA